MKSRLETRMMTGLLLGVAVYVVIAIIGDAQALFNHLTSIGLVVFMGALGLSLVNYLIRFAKWQVFLRAVEIEVPRGESALVFLSGLSMSVTPGKFGEVLKSVLLRRTRGVPVATSAPVVVAERLTDLLGLMVLAGVGLMSFDYGRPAFAIVAIVILGFLVVAHEPRWVAVILDRVERLPFIGRHRPRLDEAYASMRRLVSLRTLGLTTAMSALSWGMEAFAFWWICQSLGGIVDFELAVFVFSMTTILGAVSFLPGGLGVTEGSMMGALVLFGVFDDSNAAAAATYAIRFATLWFAVVVGFIALAAYRSRYLGRVDVFEALDDATQEESAPGS